MDKSSNIKKKSTKLMLIIYRFFLKLAFAFLILAGFVIVINGEVNFRESTLLFALTSSLIFAVSYIVAYYLYKYYNNNKFEAVKQDSIKMQIILMIRLIAFLVGATIFVYGVYLGLSNFWGYIVALIGLVISELLFANKRLFSHLSTFCENMGAGVFFGGVYMGAIYGIDYYIILLWGITLALILLQEYFYYYTNIAHSGEKLAVKEMFIIRAKYFIRNALIYTLLYIGVAVFAGANLYSVITQSNGALIFFQLLPMIISIISVVVLLYTTFHKVQYEVNTENFNTIYDAKAFEIKLQNLHNDNIMKAYHFVVDKMNSKNGYTRKSGEDYYFHCLNVANILLENGYFDENIICTALLHDCLEDLKDVNFDTICNLTNISIAGSVQLLTKKKGVDYHIDANMNDYLQNILSDKNATLVKLADRMHNMSTMKVNYSQEAKDRKIADTKKYFLPFVSKAISMYPDDLYFCDKAKDFLIKL